MAIKTSKSHDNSGEFGPPQDGSAATYAAPVQAVNQNSTERDLLINFNALVKFLANRAAGNPGFVIDTNFDIKNGNAITYIVDGVMKTLNANTSFDTGTAATIAASKWGIGILQHNGTTATVTWATTSAAMAYPTEAAAIAALGTFPALCVASGYAGLGYFTVNADAALWTAGTDALATGTGGTPAVATNYYNDPGMNGTYGAWQIGNEAGTAIVQ